MHQAEVKKYRALLMGKREEILRQSRRPEDIWIVPSNETIETVQLAGEREFAVRALEREAKSLSQIGAALARINKGEFGILWIAKCRSLPDGWPLCHGRRIACDARSSTTFRTATATPAPNWLHEQIPECDVQCHCRAQTPSYESRVSGLRRSLCKLDAR